MRRLREGRARCQPGIGCLHALLLREIRGEGPAEGVHGLPAGFPDQVPGRSRPGGLRLRRGLLPRRGRSDVMPPMQGGDALQSGLRRPGLLEGGRGAHRRRASPEGGLLVLGRAATRRVPLPEHAALPGPTGAGQGVPSLARLQGLLAVRAGPPLVGEGVRRLRARSHQLLHLPHSAADALSPPHLPALPLVPRPLLEVGELAERLCGPRLHRLEPVPHHQRRRRHERAPLGAVAGHAPQL
mmetsp:Transcript_57528/g.178596  ORF Transcript_57528/g.178596 Transcript_57528/m.178596 type:complete len:241 (+) Transcript_57528:1771-2493(+)